MNRIFDITALTLALIGVLVGATGLASAAPLDGGVGAAGFARNSGPLHLPPEVRRLPDIAYGSAPRQRFDVYLPAHPQRATVIVMVHGGAWMIGNKAMPPMVENKVAHWTTPGAGQGAIFVSMNYRLVPEVGPLDQADDVARHGRARQRGAEPGLADERAARALL